MKNITLHNGTKIFSFSNIGKVEGFEYPDTILAIENVAGEKSAIWVNSKASVRRLSFQSVIDYSQRRDLEEVLRLGNTKTLKFTTCDDVELQIEVDIDKLVMPYTKSRQIALIEMIAPDWRFYSQEEVSFDTPETVVTGGMSIPASIPFDLSGDDASTYGVTNEGNEFTSPVFRINGPFTSFTITNQTTDEYIEITDDLDNDEYIVVDTYNKTIYKNGTENIYNNMTAGYFFNLVPGFNYIKFECVGEDVTTLLTITYRHAYIGI